MKPQLTDVRGIGPAAARILEAQGIRTVAALAKASTDKVTTAPGFAETRATDVIAAAAALLAAAGAAQEVAPSPGKKSAGAKKAKTKKGKKDKNKKKNKKKKNKKKK